MSAWKQGGMVLDGKFGKRYSDSILFFYLWQQRYDMDYTFWLDWSKGLAFFFELRS